MKQAVSLGVVSGLNMLAAALVQWYIIITVGPGMQTDAFYASVTVPQFLLALICGTLNVVLVPHLAGERDDRIHRDTWTFLGAMSILFGLLAIVGGTTAPLWVPWLFHGFSYAGKELTITLARIQLAVMVCSAGATVLAASLQARRQFVRPALISLVSDLFGLAMLAAALKRYGIISAAWVGLASAVLQIALLLPTLGRVQSFAWATSSLRTVWDKVRLPLFGSAYYKTDTLVDRFLASMAGPGGFSLLYLGQQGYAAAHQIILRAVMVPLMPALAARAKSGNWEDFSLLYHKRLVGVTGLMAAVYAAFLLIGQPVLRLVIGHGAVTAANALLLWQLMAAMGGLLICGGISAITATAFYAQGDTRTPTRLGLWAYTFYVPVKVFAFLKFGLIGLAVSISGYYTVTLALQLFWLRRSLTQHLQKP